MRTIALGGALLLALCLAPAARADGLDPGFGWFAELVGACWKGSFPDGKTAHEQCYTVQYGRFVRGTARLSSVAEDGEHTVFEGDSLWAWDPATQSIVYYIWGTDGSHGRYEARYAGDELVFPVPDRKTPGAIAWRSVWKRLDAERFEVRRERPAEGGWRTEMTVSYQRSDPR